MLLPVKKKGTCMCFLPEKRGIPWRSPQTPRSLPVPPLCLEVQAWSRPDQHTADSKQIKTKNTRVEYNYLQLHIFLIAEKKITFVYYACQVQKLKKIKIIKEKEHMSACQLIIRWYGSRLLNSKMSDHWISSLILYLAHDSTLIKD